MAEPDLSDEFQPRMLTQARHCLGDLEHRAHDIVTTVSQFPQLFQAFHGLLHLGLPARLHHRLHFDRMRRVHHPEDVFSGHKAKAGSGGLQVIDGLPHISLGAEDECRDAIIAVLDIFGLGDGHQSLHDLLVGQPRIAQDSTARLQWLNDLVALIAGEGESGSRAIDLHGPPQGLLRSTRHAVGLVEDDQFLPPLRQGDFLLGETLDAVAHDVNTAFVGGVEFEHGFFVGVGAEKLPCEAEDGGGFADAGHAGNDDMGHVAIFGNDLETFDGFDVADYVVQVDGAVFLHPKKY